MAISNAQISKSPTNYRAEFEVFQAALIGKVYFKIQRLIFRPKPNGLDHLRRFSSTRAAFSLE